MIARAVERGELAVAITDLAKYFIAGVVDSNLSLGANLDLALTIIAIIIKTTLVIFRKGFELAFVSRKQKLTGAVGTVQTL